MWLISTSATCAPSSSSADVDQCSSPRCQAAGAMTGPLVGRLLERSQRSADRPRVQGDPRTDTRASAAHIVGVLLASATHGVSVRDLRAAIGISRERFEEAYALLLGEPPLGLAVQRHAEELRLITAPEVSSSVERHLNVAAPVGLSRAALEVLAIVAYRQPIARSGIALIRGSASSSGSMIWSGLASTGRRGIRKRYGTSARSNTPEPRRCRATSPGCSGRSNNRERRGPWSHFASADG
jgi:hypothetical protein